MYIYVWDDIITKLEVSKAVARALDMSTLDERRRSLRKLHGGTQNGIKKGTTHELDQNRLLYMSHKADKNCYKLLQMFIIWPNSAIRKRKDLIIA